MMQRANAYAVMSFIGQYVRRPGRHQLIASFASLVILALALSMLWLGSFLPAVVSTDRVDLREISIAMPPPPLPPPAVDQPEIETSVRLQVQGAGPSVQMIKMEKKIDVDKPDMPSINPQPTQWQSLEIDWNAFDLNDLDGLPTLLTSLRVTFPKSLSRRGIKQVLIKLDVVIDEQGQVTLANITENPHPELVSEIQRLVRNSRFTAPKKDNQPVRARFIWPVEIGL